MTRRIYLTVILIFISTFPVSRADIVSADSARAAGDYDTAIAEYTSLAQSGNAVAQATLGYMLYIGEGITQNYEAAVRWYQQAAQQGNADAQYNLAVSYAFGEGVEQNFIEAVNWYTQAAEQDHAIAQYSLGLSYSFGEGVEQNAENAASWLSRSAENGYARAQVLLGSKYHTGNGVPLDYEEASRWYLLAAEQGDAIAQYNLGSMYRSGTGVTQNLIESRRWFQQSSNQGYEPATLELNNIDRTLASSLRNNQEQPAEAAPSMPAESNQTETQISIANPEPVAEIPQQSDSQDTPPVTETFLLESEPVSSAEEITSPIETVMISGEQSIGLMDMDSLDASLPAETESVSEEMLASDTDLTSQQEESRGFFSRLFSRSRDNQSDSVSDTAEVEVPVEDYSIANNEPTDPSTSIEDGSLNNTIEETDDAQSEDSSRGFFGGLFNRRSATEEPVAEVVDEPAQEIVELAQEYPPVETIQTPDENQQEEAVVATDEQPSGGLFGRLFGRRSTSQTEQVDENEQATEQIDQTEPAPTTQIEPEPEVSEMEGEEEQQRSGGFFSRIFGRGDNEASEQLATIDTETSQQTSLVSTAENSIESVNNIYEQGVNELESKNYGEAAKHFQSAAAQGNLMAQYHLATLFYQGLGKRQDYDEAALWYRRAAEQGNVDAQYSLGNMYLMGEGIPQDDQQARYWYNQAALQGHEAAKHNVENIDRFSESNISITQDIAEEILGIDDSMDISMDESLDIGINVPSSESTNMMVASTAPTPAQPIPSSLATVDYERGLAYSFGEGVTKDLDTAFKYFKQAAEKDYAPAQYKVGVAYAYAEGTIEDKSQAMYWYEKAAMKGHTIAQRNLGVMYENGDGITQDKVKALAWYNILAQSSNVMDIRRRDALTETMGQAEISEAGRLTIELQNMISDPD